MKNIYIWPILGDLNNKKCSLQSQKQFYYLNQNDINNIIDMKCVCVRMELIAFEQWKLKLLQEISTMEFKQLWWWWSKWFQFECEFNSIGWFVSFDVDDGCESCSCSWSCWWLFWKQTQRGTTSDSQNSSKHGWQFVPVVGIASHSGSNVGSCSPSLLLLVLLLLVKSKIFVHFTWKLRNR